MKQENEKPQVANSFVTENTSETKTFTSKKSIRCSKIFIKFMFAVFVFGFAVTSCKEKNNAIEPPEPPQPPEPCICIGDYESLWTEPLETIQCCVEGDWQVIWFGNSWLGSYYYGDDYPAFIKITKDSIFITPPEMDLSPIYQLNKHYPLSMGYEWSLHETPVYGYSSYRDSVYALVPHSHYGSWIFESLINDTLYGSMGIPPSMVVFSRINKGD